MFKLKFISGYLYTINNGRSKRFYRDLSSSLGLEPCYRKIDNFKQIQEHISTSYQEQRVILVVWIDEAQYLHHSILADFKM
ncbi:MAG: AAA family ATPase [Anaerocolumna sp.]